ncbi:MAG: ABC-three component system protein [Methylocella sp.]
MLGALNDPDADLKEIKPPSPVVVSSAEHVQSGLPLPKSVRVRTFSPAEWEVFIEEWATSLGSAYVKVRRFSGPGDLGVDIAGFADKKGFHGVWDNYQCKHYGHPLRPSDVWVELGKVIYYSHKGEYVPPRSYFFVCAQGIGTTLEKLLSHATKLKEAARENWEKNCRADITDTCQVLLEGALLSHFERFDFSIFSSKSLLELIEAHGRTGYHAVRFGGGLGPRPATALPPVDPHPDESRYLRQLLDAYGHHLGATLSSADDLRSHGALTKDFLRQRERFYHAESLKNFARDTVPEGTFADLQNEIFHGVIDLCEGNHANGFERMKATVAHAANVAGTSNPLAPATKTQDRQGICHQLANDDRLIWVPERE